MAEVIALLHQENCCRGVCYKSVPLYPCMYIIMIMHFKMSTYVICRLILLCSLGYIMSHTYSTPHKYIDSTEGLSA